LNLAAFFFGVLAVTTAWQPGGGRPAVALRRAAAGRAGEIAGRVRLISQVAARRVVAEPIPSSPTLRRLRGESMTPPRRREIDSSARCSQLAIWWTIIACLFLAMAPSQAGAVSAAKKASASTAKKASASTAKKASASAASKQQPPPAESAETTRTKLVELTFVSTPLRSTDGSEAKPPAGTDPKTPDKDGVEALVDAFNALYGKDGKDAATLVRGGVLLHGDAQAMSDMMRAIDQFDQPYPQVQLNMWAVQVSGSDKKVSEELRHVAERIGKAHDNLIALKHKLVELVTRRDDAKGEMAERRRQVQDKVMKLVENFPLDEPMAFNEALILLIASPGREDLISQLAAFAGTLEKRPVAAFPRLKAALPDRTLSAHSKCLMNFLCSYADVRKDQNYYDQPKVAGVQEAALAAQRANTHERNDALALRQHTSRLDSLLHAVTEAFVADVEELLFVPLLDELRKGQSGRGDGVSLVGRSRLVVTSGIESDLDAEMASYAETTRPKPFGKDLFDALFPSAGDSSSGAGAVAKGAVTAAVPQAQVGQLAAVLLSEPEPRYSKVAPGIAVHVRPTVLADGTAARLKIDARFGVTTSDYNPSQTTDQWVQPPPPGISAHRVLTDAAVSAFDLFDISSFSVDTVVPQSPFVVPVLGRLPIIGHIFEFPRKNLSTRHESIVLVNTVILPRAMALASFYVTDNDQCNDARAKPAVAAVH
jgi:hypothetical protein